MSMIDDDMSRYERNTNRREALCAAVAATQRTPNITFVNILELADEFFQWIVKPEIPMPTQISVGGQLLNLSPGAKYRDPLTDFTFTYDGSKWVQDNG